ncbi:glycoside hydrolase family protein [Parabacteroides massiliensis]
MHGKMGGVLFFFLYARYTRNDIYEEYAEMLMEDIYNNINEEIPIDFETGLCGIGWGIEYLLQNKLVNGNSDEILMNIDRKIMERAPLRIYDYSMENGLGGILLYVNARIKSYKREMPFDLRYLTELKTKIDTLITTDRLFHQNINDFKKMMAGQIDYNTPATLPDFLFGIIPEQIDKVSNYPLGIHNGLTGFILKNMAR